MIDNLQVQWGSQDHYEIVRKVGRGKYSEVSFLVRDLRFMQNMAIGFRGYQRCQRREMHHQGAQTSQEKENQARNQDPTESRWGSEHCRSA